MRFAVIDLANLFFRAQHVTQGDAFTKAGMALHIIFGSLRRQWVDMKIDHVVFATEGGSWRYNVYPKYKVKRKLDRMAQSEREKEESEVFFDTMTDLIDFLAEKTRCTVLNSQGLEGDDLIARWVQLHPNDEHVILSGDTDFYQLLEQPGVTLVDGVGEKIITREGVTDFKGNPMAFSIDASKGKMKIAGTIADIKKKHDKEEATKAKKTPGYEKKEYVFEVEPNWWRKALFIKIVRGDVSDGIFSAYPGVRYEGSAKKTGIREAWEDRDAGGFHWNNFMLQRWEKIVGVTDSGDSITENVRVLDEFARNQELIDLTCQPEEIKDLMDEVIVQAVQKEPVGQVGINFLKFCAKHQLANLTKAAREHAEYLNAGYAR
jgi:5'-3' exonuclease